MRKGLCKIVIGLAAALTGAAVFAQAYPDRPIKLIVGIGAGSSTDAISRLIGRKLSDRLSQPVVVENRPGAGGTLGAEAGAKAPAGTPREVVDKLSAEIRDIVAHPSFREELAKFGVEPFPVMSEALALQIRNESDAWSRKVKSMKLQPQ